ncbi:right-handed parallel beta-helix repeat-containing protein [Anaerocolumna xylanovorans]|uniref:Parallel beta-helix repeat (Two copies) n=1 Tax=Anaerocolumna xylanovorans DSM 12503 TaxID=1121345 RepID=A0A1M7XZS8_9FIRM|nr:right-handed parallel beta-helix repeat-containing protein [Anaerocolumna xylanovorans]SHO44601.1 parallel beta-helix repeat (two copies) [Anaerocolumna xylanovorans DSM 12503]
MKKKMILGLSSIALLTFVPSSVLHGVAYTNAAEYSSTLGDTSDTLETKEVTASPGSTSTELQSLLDYNKDGKYKLTVHIPAGSYTLIKELRIYSNTTISADTDAKLYKTHQKGPILSNDMSQDRGGYTTSENITIIGGVWDSSPIADKNKGTESFRFIHATNITVKDAEISNVPVNSHLITFAGIKNGLIENCKLHGYDGESPKEAIQLDIVHDNVVVPSNQSKDIKYDDLPCDGILIRGNEIYDYPRAMGSHTSIKGVFHKNITITKNTLHDLTEAGIKAYNYENLEISSNYIYNVGVGILAYTYISNESNHYLNALSTTVPEPLPDDYNIKITNNTIRDINKSTSSAITSWGDGIRTIGTYTRPLNGVTIANNTIEATKRYGIFLEKTPGSIISDNTISNTADSGIYLFRECDNSTIKNNTLEKLGNTGGNAGGIGLYSTSNSLITDNTITSPAKNGIYLSKQSNTCNITGNMIYSSGGNAIATYDKSDNTTIYSNFISGYSVNGIYAYDTNSADISQNKIYGNTGSNVKDGIHIQGVTDLDNAFSLKDNYISSTRRYGIYIDANNSLLETNTITNAMKYSIYLDSNSSGSKLFDNKIDNSIWQN